MQNVRPLFYKRFAFVSGFLFTLYLGKIAANSRLPSGSTFVSGEG